MSLRAKIKRALELIGLVVILPFLGFVYMLGWILTDDETRIEEAKKAFGKDWKKELSLSD